MQQTLIEYIGKHDLDKEITVKCSKKPFKINGRLSLILCGFAELIDGLVAILSLGFLQSQFKETLLFNIFDL